METGIRTAIENQLYDHPELLTEPLRIAFKEALKSINLERIIREEMKIALDRIVDGVLKGIKR